MSTELSRLKNLDQFKSGLMPLACLMFLISILYAIVTARALYDDGSYYFMRVLEAGGFTEMLVTRGHAAFLFQLPVVIALKFGIRDLTQLQIAFGLGCFCAWPVAMALCLWLSPKHFWLVALACGAGYLNAAFVAVGEHVVAHAFFWPVVFVLLFVRPLTPGAAVVLLLSSVILVRSYETMLFFAPPLVWLAWLRARGAEKPWQRIVFLLTIFFLFAAILIAVDGTLHPCTLSSANSFKIGVMSVVASPGWTIGWTMAWLALMLGCFFAKVRTLLARPLVWLLLAGIILLWGAWPLLSPANLYPYKQYEARFLDLIVPLGLLGVALVLAKWPAWLEPARQQLVHLSAALLLAQSLWHLGATEQWRGYLNVWRHLVTTQKGLIDLTATDYWRQPAVGRQATRFVWEMDARDLCVEIGPRQVQAMVLPGVTESGEVVHGTLLEQFAPAELPPLESYGVDYSAYLAALDAAKKNPPP
jgi:hypothetical protein